MGTPLYFGEDIGETLIPVTVFEPFEIEVLPKVKVRGNLFIKPSDGSVVFRQIKEDE